MAKPVPIGAPRGGSAAASGGPSNGASGAVPVPFGGLDAEMALPLLSSSSPAASAPAPAAAPSLFGRMFAAAQPQPPPASAIGLAQFYGMSLPPPPSDPASDLHQPQQRGRAASTADQRTVGFTPASSSPPDRRGSGLVMPTHPPPPPVPTATTLATPTATPRGSLIDTTNSSGGVAPMSPKTTKLMKRIRKRDEEVVALTQANTELTEAVRRANEELTVRDHQQRVEARRRADEDTARDRELEGLRAELRVLQGDPTLRHDPAECAHTIAQLSDLLQLREEQLELINLDREKLYEEIETWKCGMEKLASLQQAHEHALAQQQQHQVALPATPTAGVRPIATALPIAVPVSAAPTPVATPPPTTPLVVATELKAGSEESKTDSTSTAMPSVSPIVIAPHPSPSPMLDTPPGSAPVIEEVWENQHRHPFFGFQATGGGALMRPPFSDEQGVQERQFEQVHLPPGWVWDSPWQLDRDAWLDVNAGEEARSAVAIAGSTPTTAGAPASSEVGTDADGWRYSIQFKLFAWHSSSGRLDTVRRRRWRRRRCWVGVQATEAMLSNALAAIRASGVDVSKLALPDAMSELTTEQAEGATLAELAAAYSSGAACDSFSMFTSVAPPGVGGHSRENSSARALAALLQLGGQSSAPAVATPAVATTDASAVSASAPSISASAAAAASAASVMSGLSSYLSNSRVASWVSRKPTTGADLTADAIVAPGVSAFSTLPSPVCSFCTLPSRTALQYSSPVTGGTVPLASFCMPHYHACLRHIALEFILANPDPLEPEELQAREDGTVPHDVCGYCTSKVTFPMQIMHLAPPTPAAPDASSLEMPLPTVTVLDVHDAYRFCAKHMPAFLKLVQQFQPPSTPKPVPSDVLLDADGHDDLDLAPADHVSPRVLHEEQSLLEPEPSAAASAVSEPVASAAVPETSEPAPSITPTAAPVASTPSPSPPVVPSAPSPSAPSPPPKSATPPIQATSSSSLPLFNTNSTSFYTGTLGGLGGSTVSQLNRALKAEEYSVRNRLRSIEDDRRFVEEVAAAYPRLRVFANLSCGAWYLSPTITHGDPVYFKSTDGHPHHWKFSDSRLNTHLVTALLTPLDDATTAVPGALIVDSTRKGKRFPDSFSRTIPIWCCVWNRAIHQFRQQQAASASVDGVPATNPAAAASVNEELPWDLDLHMPTWISPMESHQIEALLPGFVATLLSSGVDFAPIARGLRKPLRCLWFDRTSRGWANGDAEFPLMPFTPLMLVQCSRVEAETRGIGQRQGWSYIQGAGDDEENFLKANGIRGFTHQMLSENSVQLSHLDYEEDVIELIRDLIKADAAKTPSPATALAAHRVDPPGVLVAVTGVLPSCDQVVAALPASSSSESPSLALLYLYFDSTLAIKQQRRDQLATDQQRKERRIANDGNKDEDASDEEEDAASSPPAPSTEEVDRDWLDWPAEHRLSLAISSISKSRRSLLNLLPASVAFIAEQTQLGRTVVLVCEDLSYLSCICAASVLRSAASTATPSSPSASASTPSPSSSPSLANKGAVRATLASVQSHLPAHFPTRLLVQQLQAFAQQRQS